MFKEKYSRENEKINLDPATKRYIKTKMAEEENKKAYPVKSSAIIAVALSLCVLLSVVIIADKTPKVEVADTQLLTVGLTYDEIYDSFKEMSKSQNQGIIGFLTDSISLFTGGTTKDRAQIEDNMSAMGEAEDAGTPDHSTTNNQVNGVDEADMVKNDGRYIYSVSKGNVCITQAVDGKTELLSRFDPLEKDQAIIDLYLFGDKLAVLINDYYNRSEAIVKIYNVSDRKSPQILSTLSQSGNYNNSRMIDGVIYLISEFYVNVGGITKSKPEEYIPSIDGRTLASEDISCINGFTKTSYLVVSAIDINEAQITETTAVLGGAENIYCDNDNLYYTYTKFITNEQTNEGTNNTSIVKLCLSKNDIQTVATGEVEGRPLNQFSMDEYDGNLRIVTTKDIYKTIEKSVDGTSYYTTNSSTTENALYVLNPELKVIGSLQKLAEGEKVYSVRFDGEIGYFVTFRQIDPLFTVDLSNPEKPALLSELKIPGFSEYLHPFGDDLLFGFGKSATEQGVVTGLKLSMFDVSDPADVTERDSLEIKSDWSDASYNHKAIMVDYNKNIIAFTAYHNTSRILYVYGYTKEDGFFEKALTDAQEKYQSEARFVWIGDYFYLVTQTQITAFSLQNFEIISNTYL